MIYSELVRSRSCLALAPAPKQQPPTVFWWWRLGQQRVFEYCSSLCLLRAWESVRVGGRPNRSIDGGCAGCAVQRAGGGAGHVSGQLSMEAVITSNLGRNALLSNYPQQISAYVSRGWPGTLPVTCRRQPHVGEGYGRGCMCCSGRTCCPRRLNRLCLLLRGPNA